MVVSPSETYHHLTTMHHLKEACIMAKIDFKENGSKGVKGSKNSAQGQEQAQSHYFEDAYMRPLDKLAHVVHAQKAKFSDRDLTGFNDDLQHEAFEARELVKTITSIYDAAPCLDYGHEISVYDLRLHYQDLHSALMVAADKLSQFSDLALACSYASGEIASRLSALKGESA